MSKATAIYTLVKASTLKTRLTTLGAESVNNTLSLAYYTMLNGNVTPLAGCDSTIVNLLDRTYRQYVCATFNKETNKWEYNKAKATKLIESMGLTYNVSTFEEFCAAVLSNENTKAAAVAAKEEAEKALDPEEKVQAEKDRVLAYLVKTGLTETQLRDLVLQVERERSKADQKTLKAVIVTATATPAPQGMSASAAAIAGAC